MAAINAIDITSLLFQEGSAPSTPASTKWRLYFKTDGVYMKDDAGTETPLFSAVVGARVYASTATTLTTATWGSVAMNNERFDTNAFHDNATNNSRLTVPSGHGGTYLMGCNIEIGGNATGERGARIILNGATVIVQDLRPVVTGGSLPDARICLTTLYALSVADYIEAQAWQNTGSNQDTANSANSTCEFWISKVG